MTANNPTVELVKGMSNLARAKFGPGMLLRHDDLEQLNVYPRELSRLMFRSVFGCGVICGLVVGTDSKCGFHVTVEEGLALDCCGDPVQVPVAQSISIDPCEVDVPAVLWVVLCGTEKCCAPRTSMCASDEDDAPSVCTRERDGFEIRVMRDPPKCVCRCLGRKDENAPFIENREPPDVGETTPLLLKTECWCVNPKLKCYEAHYAGKCGCNCPGCSDCDCECILLARLENRNHANDKYPDWRVDHSVRRFIRPVLMRDPQVAIEEKAQLDQQDQPTSYSQVAMQMKVAELGNTLAKQVYELRELERMIEEVKDKPLGADLANFVPAGPDLIPPVTPPLAAAAGGALRTPATKPKPSTLRKTAKKTTPRSGA